MKTLMVQILGLLFFLQCCSCSRQTTPQSSEGDLNNLEIIWSSPIIPPDAPNFSLSMNPVLHEDKVFFNSEYFMEGLEAPILGFNKDNGSLSGTWSDYINGSDVFYENLALKVEDQLILSSDGALDCIDLNTFTTNWQIDQPGNGPFIFQHKGKVYYSIRYNNRRSAAILRTGVDQLSIDTVYSDTTSTNLLPSFDSMGFGELSNGDQVLLFKNRSYNWTDNLTEIYAYNLSADSLLWVNRDLDFNSGNLSLQTDGNRVYGVVHKQVFALNLVNGNMLWQRDFVGVVREPGSANFDVGAMHQLGDLLILKGDGDELVYLIKSDGSVHQVVDLEGGGGIVDDFTEFEGNLYITTKISLLIVEALSGEVLFSTLDDQRFRFKEIYSKVLIDPDGERMYFHNGIDAFCAKIPELN